MLLSVCRAPLLLALCLFACRRDEAPSQRRAPPTLTAECDLGGCSFSPLAGSVRFEGLRNAKTGDELEMGIGMQGFRDGSTLEIAGQRFTPKDLEQLHVDVPVTTVLASMPLDEKSRAFVEVPSLGMARLTMADGRSAEARITAKNVGANALFMRMRERIGRPLSFGANEPAKLPASVMVLAANPSNDTVLGPAKTFGEITHVAAYEIKESGTSKTCTYADAAGQRSDHSFDGFTGVVRIYERKSGTKLSETRIGSAGQCPQQIEVNEFLTRQFSFETVERELVARRTIAKQLKIPLKTD